MKFFIAPQAWSLPNNVPNSKGQEPGKSGEKSEGFGLIPERKRLVPQRFGKIPGRLGKLPEGFGEIPKGLGLVSEGLGQMPGAFGMNFLGAGFPPGWMGLVYTRLGEFARKSFTPSPPNGNSASDKQNGLKPVQPNMGGIPQPVSTGFAWQAMNSYSALEGISVA